MLIQSMNTTSLRLSNIVFNLLTEESGETAGIPYPDTEEAKSLLMMRERVQESDIMEPKYVVFESCLQQLLTLEIPKVCHVRCCKEQPVLHSDRVGSAVFLRWVMSSWHK